jgi:hypothetical protein
VGAPLGIGVGQAGACSRNRAGGNGLRQDGEVLPGLVRRHGDGALGGVEGVPTEPRGEQVRAGVEAADGEIAITINDVAQTRVGGNRDACQEIAGRVEHLPADGVDGDGRFEDE